MSGYLSFDASLKIHASGRVTSTKSSRSYDGGVSGWAHHAGRAEDKADGIEWKHSNSNITEEDTLDNESWYKDEDGLWRQADHSKELAEAVDRRIDYARAHGARICSGRNDSVIARGIVMQLDEELIEAHPDTWIDDCIEILESRYGKANVPCFAVHRDETSTHIHVLVTPVVDKPDGTCSISQTAKQFFANPRALASTHKQFRKAFKDKGYDVSLENKPAEEQMAGYMDADGVFHSMGLTPDQLKEISERQIDLRSHEVELKTKAKELSRREDDVKADEADLLAREAALLEDRSKFSFITKQWLERAEQQKAENEEKEKQFQQEAERLAKREAAVSAQEASVNAQKAEISDLLQEVKIYKQKALESLSGPLRASDEGLESWLNSKGWTFKPTGKLLAEQYRYEIEQRRQQAKQAVEQAVAPGQEYAERLRRAKELERRFCAPSDGEPDQDYDFSR